MQWLSAGWLLFVPLYVAVTALPLSTAFADDVLFLGSEKNPGSLVRIRGQIEELTGVTVKIRSPDGRLHEFPRRPVVRIETALLPEHQQADRLYASGEFAEALRLYRQARRQESRPWVQAQLAVQVVWCLRYMGQYAEACEEFVRAMRSDWPAAFLSAAPIAWVTHPTEARLELLCTSWLTSPEPLVQTMAASHLLQGSRRAQAVQTLERLAASAPEPVRLLVWFQLARTKLATANVDEIRQWEKTLESLPAEWRPGPTAVVAQAWDAKQDYPRAAIWWLRLPFLYGGHRDLAARGLLAAGRSLERLGKPEEARAIYQELIRRYPESADREAAEYRLRELSPRQTRSVP